MRRNLVAERHIVEWAWFVIAIGMVLRFQGLDWAQGLLLHPDERNIATAAAGLAFPGNMIPSFNAYNGLALYLPRLLAELISPWTGLPGSDEFAIVYAGRLLSAFYASLTLPILWSLARRIFALETALFAVCCAAVSPVLIQSAHFATTESGLVLCVTVPLWVCVRHLVGEMSLPRFAVLAGLTVGLGFGLKTTSLLFAVCPVTAVMQTRPWQGRIRQTLRAGALSAAIVAVLAVATTPQLLATPGAYLETMRFEGAVVRGTADVFWTYQFVDARSGLFELSQLPWLLGPAVPPLALSGLFVFAWRFSRGDPNAGKLAATVVLGVVYAAIVFTWHAKFVRYLTPLAPVLILIAAYFVEQIAAPQVRRGVMILSGLATALPGLLQAEIYQERDARMAAWDWMVPQLAQRDSIAIEPADVGPPYWTPVGMALDVAVLPLLEPSSTDKVERIAHTLADSRWVIIASRRHSAVLPRLHERFPEMCGYYRALWSGKLGYHVVATFRRRPELPAQIDPTYQAEETFTVFDSPEVFVLVKKAPLSKAQVRQAIEQATASCPLR